MNWVNPRTITGSPAEEDRYLRRQHINDTFWEYVRDGKHILFTAPRRIGKSSVMKDLEKDHPENYLVIYENIESDKSQRDLFKRLFELLLTRLGSKKKWKKLGNFLKTKGIGELSLDGSLSFTNKELDYKEELLALIKELGNEELRVVMLLDEFPDVIQSIYDNEDDKVAIDTLHTLRKIRHDNGFEKFTFVFAGSIGLHHVVSKIDGRLKLINDLEPILIEQLSEKEASMLIAQLLEEASMRIPEEAHEHLLRRVKYLLPYFIQLMIEKCNVILKAEKRRKLSVEDIDNAFAQVAKEGRNFDDWKKRINTYLSKDDAAYCMGLLTRYAHYDKYPLQKAFNYANRVKPSTHYKELLDNVLVKDGYLAQEGTFYYFQSPFLREWWKERHQAFEIDEPRP